MKARRLVLLPLFALAACGKSAPTFHADVRPVVEGRCVGCHVEGGLGPFPLTTYAEVAAVKDLVAHVVDKRVMPPWTASRDFRPLRHDPSLTPEQIATITEWAAAGAPEGDPADFVGALAPVQPGLDRVDLTVEMPEPYAPRQDVEDDYRCFPMDWPSTEDLYITGFSPEPGAAAIVHHLVLYMIDGSWGSTVDDLDASDPAPGYECYGGPGGDQAQAPWVIVGGWAPGSQGITFPEGTGVFVPAGSKLILQIHYNTVYAQGLADQSLIHVQLEPTVAKPASALVFLDLAWVVLGTMRIPAGEPEVIHAFESDDPVQEGFNLGAVPLDLSQGFLIHSSWLHMHELGKSVRLDVDRQDGSGLETLLSIPKWDFSWQRDYWFEEPAVYNTGDTLMVECVFDNSPANQPVRDGARIEPRDTYFGEGTSDEMCVAYLYVTEL